MFQILVLVKASILAYVLMYIRVRHGICEKASGGFYRIPPKIIDHTVTFREYHSGRRFLARLVFLLKLLQQNSCSPMSMRNLQNVES